MLEQAEREAKLTEEIRTRRNELSKQFGQSRLDVYFWEDNWRMVKMCQMFLYRISPAAWRTKHDWQYQPEFEKSVMSVETKDLFSKYKTPDEDATLEDLIGIPNTGKNILVNAKLPPPSFSPSDLKNRFAETASL